MTTYDRHDIWEYMQCKEKHRLRQELGQMALDVSEGTKRIIEHFGASIVQETEQLSGLDKILSEAVAAAAKHAHRYRLTDPREQPYEIYSGQVILIKAAVYACWLQFGQQKKSIGHKHEMASYTPSPHWRCGSVIHILRPMSQPPDPNEHTKFLSDVCLQGDMFVTGAEGAVVHPVIIGRREGHHQESILTRGWRMGDVYSPAYEWVDENGRPHRLGSNYKKFYCAEQTWRAWVDRLFHYGSAPWGNAWNRIFPTPIPVQRRQELVELWDEVRRQMMTHGGQPGLRNWTACHADHHRCEFWGRCWGAK